MSGAKEMIAARAAFELNSGDIVNLGFGIPMLIPHFLPPDAGVILQQENGVLGYEGFAAPGEEDDSLTDASGNHIRIGRGASFFDSSMSFAMIRGGHLDVCVLGALQVDQSGGLANWDIPGKWSPGMGGAMELAQKVKRVMVTTFHTDKQGNPKLLKECTLPLTAPKVVDTIITDLGFFRIIEGSMVLEELAEGVSVDEVKAKTGAEFSVSPRLGKWRTS